MALSLLHSLHRSLVYTSGHICLAITGVSREFVCNCLYTTDSFLVIAATTGDLYTAGSIKAKDTKNAEEMAIALAFTNPKCSTVLSDSRSAITSYATNSVTPSVVRVCGTLPPRSAPVTIRWFPAHVGPLNSREGHSNRNEEADRTAHALTSREASESPSLPPGLQVPEETTPLTTYREILEWYRHSRRTFPPPHPKSDFRGRSG